MGKFVEVLVVMCYICVSNVLCTLPPRGGGGGFSQFSNFGGLSPGFGQGFYGSGFGSFGLPYGGGLNGNYQGGGSGSYLDGGFGNYLGGGLGGYSNFLGGNYGNLFGSGYGNLQGGGLGNFQGVSYGSYPGSSSNTPIFKGRVY